MDKAVIDFIDRWSNTFGLAIQLMLVRFFSRLFPLVSGLFFGLGIYDVVLIWTDNVPIAFMAAALTAVGVEAVGFMGLHRVLQDSMDGKPVLVPMLIIVLYLMVGGGTLWLTDVGELHKIMTTAVFILVAASYYLLGRLELERVEARVKKERQQAMARKAKHDENAAERTLARDVEIAVIASDEKRLQAELERAELAEERRINAALTHEEHLRKMDNNKEVSLARAALKAGKPIPVAAVVTPVKEVVKRRKAAVKDGASSGDNGGKKVRWSSLTEESKTELVGLSTAELQALYPDISQRTLYRWVTKLSHYKTQR